MSPPMSPPERAPTRDELLAMAYVDGELAQEAVAEFEERLRQEPALLGEVATLRKLEHLAHKQAPLEPMDYEWERLERELLHRDGSRLGLLLGAIGVLGGTLWFAWHVFQSELDPWPKACAAAVLLGCVLLFGITLRARLRTLPYDSYTNVKR